VPELIGAPPSHLCTDLWNEAATRRSGLEL